MERKTIEQYRRELMLMYERAATRDPSYSQMARAYLAVEPEREEAQPVFERVLTPVTPPAVEIAPPVMPAPQEAALPMAEPELPPTVFNEGSKASLEPENDDGVILSSDEAAGIETQQSSGDGDAMGKGFMQINVTTARGTLPVQQARVTISENGSDTPLYSLTTDESGKTELVSLPAPPASRSETPENGEKVSSRYQVAVEAPGYVTTIAKGVTVFDGVTSIQPIDLPVTLSEMGDTRPRIIEEAEDQIL